MPPVDAAPFVGVASSGSQPRRLAIARAADRSLPVLLVLLLVALMTSITAVGVLTALAIGAWLLRWLDPALRARDALPLARPLGAFAGLTLLSVALSSDPAASVLHAKHLLSIPLVFVAANGFRSAGQIDRALAWLFAAVCLVSLLAVAQVGACGSSVEVPSWAAWALRVKLEACRVASPFRAKGFFSIYMTLGGSLLVSLALLLALIGERWRRWLVLPTALALVALGLTYARNGWIGLAVAVGILLALTRRAVVLVPVVLGLVIVLAVPSGLQRRAFSMVRAPDDSARERLYMWETGLRMLRDAPLLGLGPGAVKRDYAWYKHPASGKSGTGHLHSNLVQIAAERGLLGLAAWLWIWVAFFRRAGEIYAALPPARGDGRALVAGSIAAAGGFLVAGLFEYNFGDAEVIGLVWLVLAVPFAYARATAEGRPV